MVLHTGQSLDITQITVDAVDASVFSDQGTCGVGLISRDHEGVILGAKSRCYNESLKPTMVEAMAVKEA